MDISLKECCEFLRNAEDAGIFCHRNPDGDTLGSGFALHYILKSLGIRSRIFCADSYTAKYAFLMREYEPEDFSPKTLIAVDIADENLLGGKFSEYFGKIDLTIDHHGKGIPYAKKRFLEADSAAAAELIEEIREELGVPLTKQMADCIYTGVSTDTGCFCFSNTTVRSHRVAEKMFAAGCNFADINYAMFEMKSLGRLEIEKEMLGSIEYYFGGKCAIAFITAENMKKNEIDGAELEGVASLTRQIEGVEVGVTFRQRDDGWKISVRTSNNFDASVICKILGGGGHRCAAGCFVVGSRETAKETVLQAVGESFAAAEEKE